MLASHVYLPGATSTCPGPWPLPGATATAWGHVSLPRPLPRALPHADFHASQVSDKSTCKGDTPHASGRGGVEWPLVVRMECQGYWWKQIISMFREKSVISGENPSVVWSLSK